MKEIIIFGNTEFAEIAHYYYSLNENRKVAAFTVESNYIEKNTIFGLPVVAFEDIENLYPTEEYDMFIAIGYKHMNRLREKKCNEAIAKGYTLTSYISNKAVIASNVSYGYNCFILENTVIQPFSKLFNNVIVMNQNLVSHHCIIENNCYISANVTICGSVTVKNNCFLGANSCIRDAIVVAPYTLVGACAYIATKTKENGVYITESTKRCERVTNEIPI